MAIFSETAAIRFGQDHMENVTFKDEKDKAREIVTKGRFSACDPGPCEIVMEQGEQALTDAQLLAVILRTGTVRTDAMGLAKELLSFCEADRGLAGLNKLSVADMVSIDGIGKVKAAQLRCVCEIARRMAKRTDLRRIDFSKPEYIAGHYMQDMAHLDKEKVIAVLLDSRCRFIRDTLITIGNSDMAFFKPKDIFTEILKRGADSFVLLHNHPGGDPTPSVPDITMTKRVGECADMLGLRLVDHIIIGNNCYVSMHEEGRL